MKHAVVDFGSTVLAVVMVAPGQAQSAPGDQLLRELQPHFPTLPIMLIARDDTAPMGVRAYATFHCEGFLFELLNKRDLEWSDVPPTPEQEVPF